MIYLGIILAVGWSAGTILAFGYLLMGVRAEGWMSMILTILLGTPVALFLAVMPWAVYASYQAEANSPILETLHKGEWTCVSSHRVLTGKTSQEVCDTYRQVGQ